MADDGVVAAGGRRRTRPLLACWPRSCPGDAVDDAVAATGRQARRPDGKLPPHVMACFVIAVARASARHGRHRRADQRPGRGSGLTRPDGELLRSCLR